MKNAAIGHRRIKRSASRFVAALSIVVFALWIVVPLALFACIWLSGFE